MAEDAVRLDEKIIHLTNVKSTQIDSGHQLYSGAGANMVMESITQNPGVDFDCNDEAFSDGLIYVKAKSLELQK